MTISGPVPGDSLSANHDIFDGDRRIIMPQINDVNQFRGSTECWQFGFVEFRRIMTG